MGLFTSNHDGRHRRRGKTLTRSYLPGESGFVPRHCAGQLGNGRCLAHDHPGEVPMGVFPGLHEPVELDARGQVVREAAREGVR
jgi:hypothetical protein